MFSLSTSHRWRRIASAFLVLATIASVAALTATASAHDVEDGVGLVDPNQGYWRLRYPDGTVEGFYYGNPGDAPFMGDWDCDGVDTPGLYRQTDGFAYLRNSNTQGVADIRFFFGNPSDVPIPGDFNGDGCDTLSLYRPNESRFYIINELGADEGGLGEADYWFAFGNAGDTPIAGDFDGDGVDEVGLHRASTGLVYYEDELVPNGGGGAADHEFVFGDGGDRFVSGDWGTVDGIDTPGVFRPGDTTFYFRFTNTGGAADDSFVFGEATWLPVAGQFATDGTTTTTTQPGDLGEWADPHPTLRPGDSGPAVIEAQTLLTNAGFYTGPIDGAYGPLTESAVSAYQAANGLGVDGKVGPQTWASLLGIPQCPGVIDNTHPVDWDLDGDLEPGWRGETCIEQWRSTVEGWFAEPDVDTALGVLRCESWGDHEAINDSPSDPLNWPYGLFQHRRKFWDDRYSKAVDYWAGEGKAVPEGGSVFDPATNVAVAAWLVYDTAMSWNHWGTFGGNLGCYDFVQNVLNAEGG